MKRKGNLYKDIISIENLQEADRIAQKGKKNQRGVINHNLNKNENLYTLHQQLKDKTYKTSKYSIFEIKEPKLRIIARLEYYPNRITHWAIILQLDKIFKDSFIAQTYSCLKGRGIHKCLFTLNEYLKDQKETYYCLKFDIRKFYDSVDITILKSLLRRKFKDKDLLWLLDEIIDSHPSGIPIGNLLSQYFGNFYLNGFDHWIKDKKLKYLRYCDDGCILHHDKKFLNDLRKDIQNYFKTKLKLELSNYQVFPVNSRGIDMVGYVSFHSKTKFYYIRLRKSIKLRFKKMMRKFRNTKSMASYNGWLAHGNCKNLKKKYYGQ